MKKFTFIIYLMVITIGLTAQNKNDIRLNLEKMQQQYAEITLKLNRANEMVKRKNFGLRLKSDAISQKLDSTVNQVYNDLGSVWQKDYKDEFLYDQQWRNTAFYESSWNSDLKEWNDVEFKVEMSFGSNGLVNSMLWYETDSLTNILAPGARFDYFYNVDGNPDSISTYYTIDGGINWDLMAVQYNSYNASKQLIRTDNTVFDEDAGAFVEGQTTEYTYSGSGKILNTVSSYNIEGTVYPFSGSDYIYDGSDRLYSIEYSELNFFTFNLEKSSRDWFEYNNDGNVSIQIYSSWNGVVWVDEDKDEFEYTSMDLSEVAFPVFFALQGEGDGYDELKYGKAINLINTYRNVSAGAPAVSVKSAESWQHTDITSFYYSSISSTGINEHANADFKFYPNPTSENVTFNWKGNSSQLLLKMYQITGAQVLEQTTLPGKEIAVGHLVNGIYFFKLMDGQQIVYAGKLVKR